jgi:hypothetical protein
MVGMTMRPTKLLIFGSPKAGTPLMLASPTIAIDLPLKLLVWEDEQGNAWISFNSVEYLRDRYHLPPGTRGRDRRRSDAGLRTWRSDQETAQFARAEWKCCNIMRFVIDGPEGTQNYSAHSRFSAHRPNVLGDTIRKWRVF